MSRLYRLWGSVGRGDPLAFRLVLAIVVFSLVSSVLITAVQIVLQYQASTRAINARFAELEQLQLPVLSDSVWGYDESQIRVQLEAITNLPEIEHARILVQGQVSWSAGKAASRQSMSRVYPLIKNGTDIGVLEVVGSLDRVYRRLYDDALRILLQNALQTLIIAGFALVIFQRWLVRHLYRMAEYTRQMDLGRSDDADLQLDRVSPKPPDILEQLVGALNTMRANLKGAYQELADHNIELDESKKKFAAIFHSSPVALSVLHVDGDFSIIDVNEAWVSQFGSARDEVIGKDSRDARFWRNPQDCQGLLDAVREAGEIWRHEIWRRRGDDTFILCQMSARQFEVGGEQLLLLAEEDITEKRRIELEVRELNAHLEKRVEARTAELQATNAELATTLHNLRRTESELFRKEKLAALGSLVAGVAHELNTPIGNSVLIASTLNQETGDFIEHYRSGALKRSVLEDYLEQTNGATDLILRNLRRASELITSFKRIAIDQTSSQRGNFSLREIVTETVMMLGPSLKKTPYKIECDIAEGIELDSYPGPLEQVITNLIDNAVLHGFDGAPQGTVRLAARVVDETHIELCVSDDGKGIAAANLGRVFDPFFTTRLGQGGSGLGLNVVHSIVTGALGGSVGVESRVGEGTTFRMLLPMVAPHPAAEQGTVATT